MADCGVAPRLPRCSGVDGAASMTLLARGDPEAAGAIAACLAWQARPAQRASGLHPRRDAVFAAQPIRVRAGERSRPRTSKGRPRTSDRVARAWQALAAVEDPEIPALEIVDLGLVRFVRVDAGVLEVGLSPTYVGCPATEVIHHSVVQCASRRASWRLRRDQRVVAGLEQRLDHRRRPAQAAAVTASSRPSAQS